MLTAITLELGGAEHSVVQPTWEAAPHHADMIASERRLVESMFRRADGFKVIVATPTLAQGMNLPAQMVILAGDKRQDEDGRTDLKSHEILNAAGRAGRAGHLANGVVLLVPEPVVGFAQNGQPEPNALEKLRSVLPQNDQCVELSDPLTNILDRIQGGLADDRQVQYVTSRLLAGSDDEQNADAGVALIGKSFAAFCARRENENAAFDEKVNALRVLLDATETEDRAERKLRSIAASNGLAFAPLSAIRSRLSAAFPELPTTVLEWANWLLEFLQQDVESREGLLSTEDAATVVYVVRGRKDDTALTAAEFGRLKAAAENWLTGQPFTAIEAALGVPDHSIGHCPRARDFALKLASRGLYLVVAALADIARDLYDERGAPPPQPAVLDVLAIAFRKGLDSPDKVAFATLKPGILTRTLLHRRFAELFGDAQPRDGREYKEILDEASLRLTFIGGANR